MSLPFLSNKNRQQSGVMIQERKPDSEEKQNDNEGLEACMAELSEALKSGDHSAAAKAFRNASQLCDDDSGDDQNDNSYDDMNQQAAEEQD